MMPDWNASSLYSEAPGHYMCMLLVAYICPKTCWCSTTRCSCLENIVQIRRATCPLVYCCCTVYLVSKRCTAFPKSFWWKLHAIIHQHVRRDSIQGEQVFYKQWRYVRSSRPTCRFYSHFLLVKIPHYQYKPLDNWCDWKWPQNVHCDNGQLAENNFSAL